MADFATLHQFADFVIVDFVAPLKEMRDIFDADFTIWVDTIIEGRFEDTNKVFQIPESYDVRVDTQDAHKWAPIILAKIVKSARLAKLDK
jgi:adenylylsulfate kinase